MISSHHSISSHLPHSSLPANSDTLTPSSSLHTSEDTSILSYFPTITTNSPHMLRILKEAHKFAQASSCILIQGESGTGKEMMAHSLHRLSSRKNKNMITVNCSAISEGLLESELFGHVKGAFTGADRHKEGFFAKANEGTLFLDEIGDMPLRLQAKLLRVLQNQAYHQVGSTELKRTDVRIIAATNVDLNTAVKKRKFRLDLYYRLNVLPIEMLPLRRRVDDIEPLIHKFLKKGYSESSYTDLVIHPSCIQQLKQYYWPGNIRELENLTKRLMITKQHGIVYIEDLPTKYQYIEHISSHTMMHSMHHGVEGATRHDAPQSHSPSLFEMIPSQKEKDQQPAPQRNTLQNTTTTSNTLGSMLRCISIPKEGISLSETMRQLEGHLIRCALSMTQDNKYQAAQILGIKRTTLQEKIKRNNITTTYIHPPTG